MGPVVPFIPHIISGAGALGGSIFGRKQGEPDAGERAMAGQQAALGQQLGAQGQSLFNFGNPLLKQSAGYYQKLLGGDRAAMGQAIQPEVSQITDVYRGAEKGLERSGVRGASRDVAAAELGRSRAGAIAGLIPGLRPGAAAATGALGQYGTQQGTAATQGASGIYSSLLQGGRADREIANKQGGALGSGLGSFLADVMKTQSSKGKPAA